MLPQCRILVLKSGDSPSPSEEETIISTAQQHAEQAAKHLQITWPVNITIYPNAAWAVPETGEGGYTPSKDWSQIYLDLTGGKHPVEKVISERMVVALYHEMNHLKRWGTTGYGDDLESALVSEGLAGVFERKMYPSYVVPWLSYSREEVEVLLKKLREVKKSMDKYDHGTWFFGTDPSVPKWLGYSVGHYIVSRALELQTEQTLESLMLEQPQAIIKMSQVEL